MNPECSASVRVGLGLCCYKLGQIPRAQAAMARALQLDPQNVQALVGSAILELSTASTGSQDAARRTESAINTISMAYHVDAKNAMVLNHLADHYFWTWSPLKATLSIEQGSRSGTVSSDVKQNLAAGDIIRIGSGSETAVGSEGFDGTTLHLRKAFVAPSGEDLKLYTKDYRKVEQGIFSLGIRFATLCVSHVFFHPVPMHKIKRIACTDSPSVNTLSSSTQKIRWDSLLDCS